jgi:hypothetical protein
MLQTLVPRQRLVALGNGGIAFYARCVPLHQRRRKPRLQHPDIGWKMICVLTHAQH